MRSPAALLLLFLAYGHAQTPAKLSFEVASIKLNTTDSDTSSNIPLGNGDVYHPTGGRFSARDFPISLYLQFAYKLPKGETDRILAKLPAWVGTERFDIEARATGEPTKDQMREMIQSLLADRCKLTWHYKTRQTPVYAVVLVKPGQTGPNLRPHPAAATCSADPSDTASDESGNFPAVCGGIMPMPPTMRGNERRGGRDVSMDLIVRSLPGITGDFERLMVDHTGLTGKFDFSLEWTQAPDGSDITQALKTQLGLKLDSQKVATKFMVVDHLERPSVN